MDTQFKLVFRVFLSVLRDFLFGLGCFGTVYPDSGLRDICVKEIVGIVWMLRGHRTHRRGASCAAEDSS